MTVTKVAQGKWRADFREPGTGKRIIRTTFKTKKAAEDFEAEKRRQHATGNAVDDRAARSTTVGTLWQDFRAHVAAHGVRGNRPAKPKTLKNYDFRWTYYVAPSWQYTPLTAVTRPRCSEWLASMQTASGTPATAGGVREGAAVLTRLLDFAMERGLLEFNPMKSRTGNPLPTPKPDDSRPNVYLTPRQLHRLAALAPDNMAPLILTDGVTGLRWVEIGGLVGGEVDLGDAPRVIIPRARSKTDEARSIGLPRQIVERLTLADVGSLAADAPVFPAARGDHWSYPYFMKKFRPVAARASTAIATLQEALGVTGEHVRTEFGGGAVTMARYGERTAGAVGDWQEGHGMDRTEATPPEVWTGLGLPDLSPVVLSRIDGQDDDRDMPAVPTFHDLRHTAVSLGIQAGLNIKLVQQIAGHKTATMTLDTYGHLYPEDVGKAADAMSEVLSGVLE